MAVATIETPEPLTKLRRDVKLAAATMSRDEVRFLVDAYYMWQEARKRSDNQVRALGESDEPHEVLNWLAANSAMIENSIKGALGAYSQSTELGKWAESIRGIGPVISAGLMAHIDIEQAPTVGHIWRFAGLDPTTTWGKGEKRPWNAALKTLCWKAGESFVKVSNHDEDIYGHVYAERKEQEQAKNEAGDFSAQAAQALLQKRYGKETAARKFYEDGQLPPAHIHARAKRYAVKLFLSHWHHVAYELRYGKAPPKPYILTTDAHTHFLVPPNWG